MGSIVVPVDGGLTLSEILAHYQTEVFEPILSFQRGSVEPTVRVQGMWWNAVWPVVGSPAGVTRTGIHRWNGSAWLFVCDPTSVLLTADGEFALTANWHVGNYRVSSGVDGTLDQDYVRLGQVVLRNGDNVMLDHLNFADGSGGFFKCVNLGAPSAAGDSYRFGDLKRGQVPLTVSVGLASSAVVDMNFIPRSFTLKLLNLRIGAGTARYRSESFIRCQNHPTTNAWQTDTLAIWRVDQVTASPERCVIGIRWRILDNGTQVGVELEVNRTTAGVPTGDAGSSAWEGDVHWEGCR